MLITCPNCSAGYDVPDHLLAGDGRRLRCARCAQEWHALLPEPPPPDPAPTALRAPPPESPHRPAVAPIAAPPPQPGPHAHLRLALAAWALSLAVVGAAGWGAVHWRGDVMVIWPPSERAYQLVGLE